MQLLKQAAVTVVVVAALLGCTPQTAAPPPSGAHEEALRDELDRRTSELIAARGLAQGNAISILVEPGDATLAKAYYARITPLVGFNPETSNLDFVLQYLGYPALSATSVEVTPPAQLMAAHPADAILATQFFAPKIVDFNLPASSGNHFDGGWRRLVRINATSGSAAERAGILAAYVLFNYVQPDPSSNPFASESKQNQVILVPKTFKSETEDAAFFLVFGPGSGGYKVGYALNAGFDLPSTPGGPTKKDYFLPTACAQCHGHDAEFGGEATAGTFSFAKLNYLDSDQWYDMAAFDFPATAAGPFDVLVDGGKDHALPAYAAAVAVVRRLNTEIRQQSDQSRRPDGSDAFKVLSVEKWLEVHNGNDQPVPMAQRALRTGVAAWNPTNSADQAALAKLNQHCFRCHGSMYYSVFDRQTVVKKKARIISYITSGRMPQGRTLTPTERQEFVAHLSNVK